ncbi:MAG: molybdate ABC transporter substrate-binding protein [Candidatus Eremiobacteraeota bacterium]|nr:molybdate ABC transporter substrate-binding protein [Candidatus Eremiobacteraeota bacterium]
MITLVMLAAAAQAMLTVFAASSLHSAFPELGKRFEATRPGVTVRFEFNGSQLLEAQLVHGAPADVFASADQFWMDKAASEDLVAAWQLFATNSLVIVASANSPVHSPGDLTQTGLRLVLCAHAVPCGRYAQAALTAMESNPTFGKGFRQAVTRNVASEEENVESVLAKVALGEADAGIVYRSDVVAVPANVRVVELPPADQPPIVYPIAVIKASASPELAADFIAFVRSSEGKAILRRFGFLP